MFMPMGFFFRRQFCGECFPPQRDGGVWEVQRSGPQAEERAGRNRVYFCYYLLFMPDATSRKMTLFRVPVLSEDKPSLSFWRTNWDRVSIKETHFALVVGDSSSLSWNDCILCWCIINATFFADSSEWAVLIWFLGCVCVCFFFPFSIFTLKEDLRTRSDCACVETDWMRLGLCIPPSNSVLN